MVRALFAAVGAALALASTGAVRAEPAAPLAFWPAGRHPDSDIVHYTARRGQRIGCAVTPSDGRLRARPTAVSATATG